MLILLVFFGTGGSEEIIYSKQKRGEEEVKKNEILEHLKKEVKDIKRLLLLTMSAVVIGCLMNNMWISVFLILFWNWVLSR